MRELQTTPRLPRDYPGVADFPLQITQGLPGLRWDYNVYLRIKTNVEFRQGGAGPETASEDSVYLQYFDEAGNLRGGSFAPSEEESSGEETDFEPDWYASEEPDSGALGEREGHVELERVLQQAQSELQRLRRAADACERFSQWSLLASLWTWVRSQARRIATWLRL